jgi:phosphatidate cytidylyltransferase
MLVPRILTAVFLLALLLPALFADNPIGFYALTLLLTMVGAWEWARLAGLNKASMLALVCSCMVLCWATWLLGQVSQSSPSVWVFASVFWCLLTGYFLWAGPKAWQDLGPAPKWFIGLLVLWLAWWAMAAARAQGVLMLLSIFVVVWGADVFAYFVGKTLGGRIIKRKLAPTISPGKSWEGAIGGWLGVVGLSCLWMEIQRALSYPGRSLFQVLWQHGSVTAIVCLTMLVAASVVGDLLESLIKRGAGVKDSSGLLPGHGGVLDRLDALLPALPLAMLILAFVSQEKL